MDKHKKIGNLGEQLAEKFLIKNNYLIIDKNYKCKFGEIDIIAHKNKQLIFCEVKTRSNKNYGTGLGSIDKEKQIHMCKTALYYLNIKNMYWFDIRFDAIEVNLNEYENNIIHYLDIIEEIFY